MEGFYLAEWDPPSALWNQSLKTLQWPAKYGIHVVLVKSRTGDSSPQPLPVVPGPDYIVAAHDALIIYGSEEDIDRALAF